MQRRDPAAGRALVAAMHGRAPEGWNLGLAAIRREFPAAPGLPRLAPHAAVTAAIPDPGLPLGPVFDLGTRWRELSPSWPTGANTVAMSADSVVLSAPLESGELSLYDPYAQTWTQVYTAPAGTQIVGLAADQVLQDFAGYDVYRKVWVQTIDAQNNFATQLIALVGNNGKYVGSVNLGLAPLPGGDWIEQVAAGSDGTAWAIGGVSKQLYSYGGTASNTWTKQSSGGNLPFALSVGSAGNVWLTALEGLAPNYTTQSFRLTNGVWQPLPALPGLGAGVGTADGTFWGQTPAGLSVLPPGATTWVTVDAPVPPSGLVQFAAASRYRLVGVNQAGGLSFLTYGLADQPATGYAAWTTGRQAAYDAINTQLGFARSPTVPARSWGLRQQYTNQFAVYDLALFPSLILTMARPRGVSAGDWQAVRSQLLSELSSVLATYRMFDELDSLNLQIAQQATALLSQTKDLVELSTDDQAGSIFTVVFTDLFEAALAGLAGAASVVSPAGGIVAAILASGIDSGIGDVTGGGSGTSLQTTYVKLQTQLASVLSATQEANSGFKGSILSDPGRFLAVGAGILDGTLYWPPGSNQKLAQATDDAFEGYFLRKLAPLQWKVLKFELPSPDIRPPGVPSYASYFDAANDILWALGNDSGLFYKYPSQPLLISEINRLTGSTTQQLVTNQQPGWFTVETINLNSPG